MCFSRAFQRPENTVDLTSNGDENGVIYVVDDGNAESHCQSLEQGRTDQRRFSVDKQTVTGGTAEDPPYLPHVTREQALTLHKPFARSVEHAMKGGVLEWIKVDDPT
jgi:hypothetical protein